MDGEDSRSTATGAPTQAAPREPPAPHVLSPEEDLNAAISRDLRSKMELARELGRGAADLTNELCEAALSEAEGRASEALGILRSAQSRLESQTDELVRQRLTELGERRESLEKTGAHISVGDDLRLGLGPPRYGRAGGRGFRRVVDTDRRMTQFESDWRGLQGLLAQVEGLRSEASEIGIPLGEIASEVEAIRDRLREPNLTEDALDVVAQEAAQTLMLLHEAIPSALAEELLKGESVLDRYPEDHAASAVAKRLHLEVMRHLKKGRLAEAVRSVQDLRRELAELEVAAAASPAIAAIPGPTIEETEEEMLDRLLKKARSLASRVRTLPPDSDIAHDCGGRDTAGDRPPSFPQAQGGGPYADPPHAHADHHPDRGAIDEPGASRDHSDAPSPRGPTERGRALEVEGLPFPTDNIRDAFLEAARDRDVVVAADVLKRAEALLDHAWPGDWVRVRELLRRADQLRRLPKRSALTWRSLTLGWGIRADICWPNR